MSKKSKRQVRRTIPPAAPAPKVASTNTGGGRSFDREFAPDYSYVVKDLRRIGTLAGAFFVVLIALSFIMPLILH